MTAWTVTWPCPAKTVLVGRDFGDASVPGACDPPGLSVPPFGDESETHHDR